jgi:hypothetical protein
MELAGSDATWTGSPKGVFAERKHHKPRQSLKNNTAGVREREDENRTRVAGSRDGVEGVVASALKLLRDRAVGFIDWLDLLLITSFFAGVVSGRLGQTRSETLRRP